MHADIPALHDLAASHSRHAADLRDVAARLTAAAPQPEAFGPIGARFLAALLHAVEQDAAATTALAARLVDGSDSATATASAYADADHRVGQAVGSLEV